MNQRYLATLALQRPEHPRSGPRDVCPHCKRETAVYRFLTPDGCRIESHHCEEHGDVPPMRSAIINPALPAAVEASHGGRATPPVEEGIA